MARSIWTVCMIEKAVMNRWRLKTDNTDDLTILNAYDNCIQIERTNYKGQMFDPETMKKMCQNVEMEVYDKLAPETFFMENYGKLWIKWQNVYPV